MTILALTILFLQNDHPESVVVCQVTSIVTFNPYHAVSIYALAALMELNIYFVIYYFLYKQNKAMKQLLPLSSFKRRRRENAISFTGHFVHFIFELLICASFTIGVKVYGISPDVNYLLGGGPKSIAILVSSKPLRVLPPNPIHSLYTWLWGLAVVYFI